MDWNKEQTLENLEITEANKFAYAALIAAIESPEVYNPLILCGDEGPGKTHMLTAVANYIHDNDENVSIIYKTGDMFVRSYETEIDFPTFCDLYRDVEVLLVDDVEHILADKILSKHFFDLIKWRSIHNRRTIFSGTNYKELEQLEKSLKLDWSLLAKTWDEKVDEID